jgi:hypothetical protein
MARHALPTLTADDAIAIKCRGPLTRKVSPNVDDSIQAIYGSQNECARVAAASCRFRAFHDGEAGAERVE